MSEEYSVSSECSDAGTRLQEPLAGLRFETRFLAPYDYAYRYILDGAPQVSARGSSLRSRAA